MNATEAVAVLRAAIEKHRAPEWECNSDHPALLAALNATAAIAPPVAAGSVDIEKVLLGIDQDETESDNGWWETSAGAGFGKRKKDEIIAWGAQQRIEGKREGADTVAMAEQMKLFRSAHDEACIELKERAEKAEARVRDLEEAISTDDRILRSSVPERWKDCASPVGAVQSYIAELEQFEPGNHYDMS